MSSSGIIYDRQPDLITTSLRLDLPKSSKILCFLIDNPTVSQLCSSLRTIWPLTLVVDQPQSDNQLASCHVMGAFGHQGSCDCCRSVEEGIIPVMSISDEIIDRRKAVNLVFYFSIVKWMPYILPWQIGHGVIWYSFTGEEEMVIGQYQPVTIRLTMTVVEKGLVVGNTR